MEERRGGDGIAMSKASWISGGGLEGAPELDRVVGVGGAACDDDDDDGSGEAGGIEASGTVGAGEEAETWGSTG